MTNYSQDSEFSGMHLFSQLVNLPPGVAEDDGLSDRHGFIEIAKRVQFSFLLFDGDINRDLDDIFRGLINENKTHGGTAD